MERLTMTPGELKRIVLLQQVHDGSFRLAAAGATLALSDRQSGWMVANLESSGLAKVLLATTINQQGADPTKLTIHADRGSSMKSTPVAFTPANLGATESHSRPHVSYDNPHIESFFKTAKYQPEFPATFANMARARAFCGALLTGTIPSTATVGSRC